MHRRGTNLHETWPNTYIWAYDMHVKCYCLFVAIALHEANDIDCGQVIGQVSGQSHSRKKKNVCEEQVHWSTWFFSTYFGYPLFLNFRHVARIHCHVYKTLTVKIHQYPPYFWLYLASAQLLNQTFHEIRSRKYQCWHCWNPYPVRSMKYPMI